MAMMVHFITKHLALYLTLCGCYQYSERAVLPKPILQMRKPRTQRRATLPRVSQLKHGRADNQTQECLNLKDNVPHP